MGVKQGPHLHEQDLGRTIRDTGERERGAQIAARRGAERKNVTTKLPRTTLGTGLARTEERKQGTQCPREGWVDGTPPPHTFLLAVQFRGCPLTSGRVRHNTAHEILRFAFGTGSRVGEILSLEGGEPVWLLQNKLMTRAQYLDEVSWTTKQELARAAEAAYLSRSSHGHRREQVVRQ